MCMQVVYEGMSKDSVFTFFLWIIYVPCPTAKVLQTKTCHY